VLARPKCALGLKSLYFYPPKNHVVYLDLSGNGMDGEVGAAIATLLQQNRVLTHVDLSDNLIDDQGGVLIARAMGLNQKASGWWKAMTVVRLYRMIRAV
jgi:hypothetical protein